MNNAKILVVLSGGQDSTTCLAAAIASHGVENVHTITFDYGQRHDIEVTAARHIARLAGIGDRATTVVLPSNILLGSSPLVNKEKAVEEYANAAALPGGLEKTFVPMRNQLFLTIAANHAAAIASSANQHDIKIVTGLSQEDYGGYPDCRGDFIMQMNETIMYSLDDPDLPRVTIETPLLNMSKKQTVEYSEELPRARELLAFSHTCYNGACPPCGKCHACLLRSKGYAEAGVTDPLVERVGA